MRPQTFVFEILIIFIAKSTLSDAFNLSEELYYFLMQFYHACFTYSRGCDYWTLLDRFATYLLHIRCLCLRRVVLYRRLGVEGAFRCGDLQELFEWICLLYFVAIDQGVL